MAGDRRYVHVAGKLDARPGIFAGLSSLGTGVPFSFLLGNISDDAMNIASREVNVSVYRKSIAVSFPPLARSLHRSLPSGFDIATSGGVLVAEIMIDFIFMIDVGLNFRTTAVDEATKETITDVRQISKR